MTYQRLFASTKDLFCGISPIPHLSLSEPEITASSSDNPNSTMASTQDVKQNSASLAALLKKCEGRGRVQQIQIQEDGAIAAHEFFRNIGTILKKYLPHIPSCQNRIDSLTVIESRKKDIGVTIGFLGNTGDGKSSAMNCLIGINQLLPNSTEMACTAVPVEISYNISKKPEEKFIAVVKGVPAGDFKKEIDNYYKDRILWKAGGEGESGEDDPEIMERMEGTLAKVQCILPSIVTHEDMDKTFTEELLKHPNVMKTLDKTFTICAKDPDDFRGRIKQYIDTSESKDEDGKKYSVWPLIKVVKLRVKADILKCGITLVDLPGGRDTSAARSAVAADYLKNLTIACVLTRAARAANDKGARDALSQESRRTMQLDGIYSSASLFFIISQIDIGFDSFAEVEKYIREHENLKELTADDLQRCTQNFKNFKELDTRQSKINQHIKNLEAAQKKPEARLQILESQVLKIANGTSSRSRPNKRKYNSIDECKNFSLTSKQKELISQHRKLAEQLRNIQKRIRDFFVELGKIDQKLKANKEDRTKVKARLQKVCINNRSELQSALIQENYEKARKRMGDENPDKALRIYPISATAFQSMKRKDFEDALNRGFSMWSDTGIPDLRDGLMGTTLSAREDYARSFLEDADSQMTLLKMWIGDGKSEYRMSEDQRSMIEARFKDNIAQFQQEISDLNTKTAGNVLQHVRTGLLDVLPMIERCATAKAKEAVQIWTQKPVIWSTHRATNRSNGEWTSSRGIDYDWNEDLVNLFLGEIVRQWDKTFHRELPKLRQKYDDSSEQVISSFVSSLKDSVRDMPQELSDALDLLGDILVRSHRDLRYRIDRVFQDIDIAKKKTHRLVKPEVLKTWISVYTKCGIEGGSGHYGRNKKAHKKHVKALGGPLMYKNISRIVENALELSLKKLPERFAQSYLATTLQIEQEIKVMLDKYSTSSGQTHADSLEAMKKKAMHEELAECFKVLEKAWEMETEAEIDDSDGTESTGSEGSGSDDEISDGETDLDLLISQEI